MKVNHLFGLACAGLLLVTVGSPAWAQATRTFVSGVGDDANPCSRTAPCKTFAGAIAKTAAGGEIDCLDPGGFGAVAVTKSITLDCGGGGLIVEHVGIFGFGTSGSTGTYGAVDFEPNSAAKLNMLDVECQYGLGD